MKVYGVPSLVTLYVVEPLEFFVVELTVTLSLNFNVVEFPSLLLSSVNTFVRRVAILLLSTVYSLPLPVTVTTPSLYLPSPTLIFTGIVLVEVMLPGTIVTL